MSSSVLELELKKVKISLGLVFVNCDGFKLIFLFNYVASFRENIISFIYFILLLDNFHLDIVSSERELYLELLLFRFPTTWALFLYFLPLFISKYYYFILVTIRRNYYQRLQPKLNSFTQAVHIVPYNSPLLLFNLINLRIELLYFIFSTKSLFFI